MISMSRSFAGQRETDESFKFDLAAARVGDLTAMGRLLEASRAYLLMIANQEFGTAIPTHWAESDVVQLTLGEAHQGFDRFRGETAGELRGWLRRTLLNNVRDVARRYSANGKRFLGREVSLDSRMVTSLIDPEPTPATSAVAEEERDRLKQGMAGLSEVYCLMLELRFRDRLSYAEIGRQVGRSEDAARMLLFRAVERLEKELRRTIARNADTDTARS